MLSDDGLIDLAQGGVQAIADIQISKYPPAFVDVAHDRDQFVLTRQPGKTRLKKLFARRHRHFVLEFDHLAGFERGLHIR